MAKEPGLGTSERYLKRAARAANWPIAPLSLGLSMISGQTLRVCPEGKPVSTFPDHALALRLHAVDMFRTRKSAGAHVDGVALDRGFDHRDEIAVAADKFGRPRRQPQHILQHQYLAIAGRTGADADGWNDDGFRDLPGQRFC